MDWLYIEDQGIVPLHRIIAISPYESAPIRRLLSQMDETLVVVLTNGRRRQTTLFLDSGHAIITALPLQTWAEQLQTPLPPFP